MKTVDYVCEKCGKIREYTVQSMKEDYPKRLKCDECGTMTMKYDWEQVSRSTTVIPEHMRATSNDRLNYNKMNRDQKKYY